MCRRDRYEARKAAWERAKKYARPVTGTTQQNTPAPPATEQKKRVFVTGGAEGIGRAIAVSYTHLHIHSPSIQHNYHKRE